MSDSAYHLRVAERLRRWARQGTWRRMARSRTGTVAAPTHRLAAWLHAPLHFGHGGR